MGTHPGVESSVGTGRTLFSDTVDPVTAPPGYYVTGLQNYILPGLYSCET